MSVCRTIVALLTVLVVHDEFTAPFSAEVVSKHGQTVERSRVNVANGKIRAESIEGGDATYPIAILDFTAGTVLAVNPTDRTYIDMRDLIGPFASQFARLYRVAQPVDPANPCAEMAKMASRFNHLTKAQQDDSTHIACAPIGPDTVDGRPADKWRLTATRGDQHSDALMWVDTKLRFVTKSVDSASTSEVRNIQEGPQSPDLFEVPPGYKRLKAGSILAGAVGHGVLDFVKKTATQAAEDRARDGASSIVNSIVPH
jgi:hypothetical protein